MSEDTSAIRPAALADLPAIEMIVAAAYSPYIARLGKPPGPMLDDYRARILNGTCRVAEIDGAIGGLLVTLDDGKRFLLDNVAVDPAMQGRGVGRALIEAAIADCRAAGHDELWLYTHALMTENIALYGRIGFAERYRVSEKGYARVYMAKAV